MEENDIKIILLGETGVGKTNLIAVFLGAKFKEDTLSTMACYSYSGKYQHKKKSYNYAIWDTAGQEKYRALNKMFVRDAQIIILVYSIIDRSSFKELDYWLQYAKENKGDDDYILGLVANKSDLYDEETVTEEEGIKFASDNKIKFAITSALRNSIKFTSFVNELIGDYIDKFILNESKNKDNFRSTSISINNQNRKNGKKKCC